MKKTYITVFYLNGEYHSTQDKKVSYDWCINGAKYEIQGVMYEATVSENDSVAQDLKIKICTLKPIEYITL